MKVTRRVDTVKIEIDIDTAEKLLEILYKTYDDNSLYGDLMDLSAALALNADVRHPSPLYVAETTPAGLLRIRNRTHNDPEV